MTHTDHVRMLTPLVVGLGAILCTIFIHALAGKATVDFVRRETKLGQAGTGFWRDVSIVMLAMVLALVAHLLEMALWAALFVICGEFTEFGIAFYHSAVNYTTLGYGDLIMSPAWRLLGPLEAADGTLMFGVSTAMIFAVVLKLTKARFVDLRS